MHSIVVNWCLLDLPLADGCEVCVSILRLRMLDIEYLLSSCTLLLDETLCHKVCPCDLASWKVVVWCCLSIRRTWRSNEKCKIRGFPSISFGQSVNLINLVLLQRVVGDRRECCLSNHDDCCLFRIKWVKWLVAMSCEPKWQVCWHMHIVLLQSQTSRSS